MAGEEILRVKGETERLAEGKRWMKKKKKNTSVV